MSAKGIDPRHMVQPPVFADENDYPAESKDSRPSAFPQGKSAMAAMKKLAESKMAADCKGGDESGRSKSGASRRGAGFGRLLSDVTNEQKEEQVDQDEKHALELQCDDALDMAAQWMQMDQDEAAAKDVHKQLQKEDEAARKKEVQSGESAALKVAIEERRRLQSEAEAKKSQERHDIEFAKKTVLADVEDAHEFKELCDKDNEVAARVHAQLQDEMMAEELQQEEDRACEQMRSQLKAADAERAAADFEVARQSQVKMDVLAVQSRLEQETADAAVALRIAIASSRADHRRRKRLELIHSPIVFNSIEKVAKQWEDAEADVEDVAGGLCLTLLLPYLRDIKLKSEGGGNTVDLEAFRIISSEEHERGLETEENSMYCAEFMIEGSNVHIDGTDLSFEYSSESGLLHIYVEAVHLDHDSPEAKKDAENAAIMAAAESKGKQAKDDVPASVPTTTMGKLASRFKRMLGGNKR